MKRKLYVCLKIMAIVILLASLSACGLEVQDRLTEIVDETLPAQSPLEEEVTEALISEESLENVATIESQLSEASNDVLKDETERVAWSSEIPAVFIEFTEGYCIDYHYMKDAEGDLWMLTFIDVNLEDVMTYKQRLEVEGWVKEDEVLDLMCLFTKDGYETTATQARDEDGTIWYTLYLSDKREDRNGSDLNHLDGGDIPEGYPDHLLPVYSSKTSTLVGAAEINAGGSTIYSIEIACDESPDEIVEVIYPYLAKLDGGKATKMLMNGNGLLQGASDEWYITVIIEAVEYNGKATSIVYQLSPMVKD